MNKVSISKILYFILLALSFVPALFLDNDTLTTIFFAFVITYYTAKFGAKYTIWGVLLFLLLLFSQADLIECFFLLLFSVPFYVVGQFMFKKGTFGMLLSTGTFLLALILGGYTKYLASLCDQTPSDYLLEPFFSNFLQSVKTLPQMDNEMLSQIQTYTHALRYVVQSMLPCFYIIFALICIYIVFAGCRILLKKQKISLNSMPYFHEFYLPRSIINIFIVLFLASFLGLDSPVVSNMVAVMFSIFVFCGISLVSYFLKAKGIPKIGRWIIFVVIFFLYAIMGTVITMILCYLGMNTGLREIGRKG